MKKLLLLLVLFPLGTVVSAQTPCNGTSAGSFPCNNFDLQSRITPGQMSSDFANDSWGWVDPQDGKEYALIGLNNGTAFIDISDPINPVYLGKLPTHTSSSTWRDLKVYKDHVFVVSEAGGHGMQVFDLTRLRNVVSPPQTFNEDAHFSGFGSAHNIVINEVSGFAYAVGSDTFSGGAHFVNIQNPTSPLDAGGYADDNYTHDAQVVTYDGPDTDYTGRELFIGSNGDFGNDDEVVIVDITDKNNPQHISSVSYGTMGYAHQGWFTEDQRYFLLGDELDEGDFGFNTRTIIFDLSDLDNPVESFEFFGPTSAIDHNGYVVGDKFYMAAYSAGLRVLDISDIANQNISEYGFFDTFPSNNQASFNGAWNVYPFFPSRNIIISGDAGFTLVRDPNALSVSEVEKGAFALYPNPVNGLLTIQSNNDPIKQIEIYNVVGQQVYTKTVDSMSSMQIDTNQFNSGLYLVKVNNTTTQKLIVK